MEKIKNIENKNEFINQYTILNQIGSGTFSSVYKAFDQNKMQVVAIKCVDKKLKQKNKKAYELFETEIAIIQQLNNPNIIQYIDSLQDEENYYLIIEYCNKGDLQTYAKQFQGNKIPIQESLSFFQQLLSAFKVLHQHKIIHRDIKLQNILLSDYVLKIADFGFAKQLASLDQFSQTQLGTPITMAPEIINGQPYDITSDIYSLGIVLYQMIYGKFPYIGQGIFDLLQLIQQQDLQFDDSLVKVDEAVKDLLRKMLKYNPKDRISWKNLYNHPLFVMKEQEKEQQLVKPLNIQQLIFQTYQMQNQENGLFYDSISKSNKQNNDNQLNVISNKSKMKFQKVKQINNNDSKENFSPEKCQIQIGINETQLNNIQQCYLDQINLYKLISQAVVSQHNLQDDKLDKLFPAFLLLKKLRKQIDMLLVSISEGINVFGFDQFDLFTKNSMYQQIIKQIEADSNIAASYYMQRECDFMKLYDQTSQGSLDDYMKQIEDQFPLFYKQELINYLMDMQGLIDIIKQKNPQSESILIYQKHMIEIIDCIMIEQYLQKSEVKYQQILWFEKDNEPFPGLMAYESFRQSLNQKNIEEFLNKKIQKLFSY